MKQDLFPKLNKYPNPTLFFLSKQKTQKKKCNKCKIRYKNKLNATTTYNHATIQTAVIASLVRGCGHILDEKMVAFGFEQVSLICTHSPLLHQAQIWSSPGPSAPVVQLPQLLCDEHGAYIEQIWVSVLLSLEACQRQSYPNISIKKNIFQPKLQNNKYSKQETRHLMLSPFDNLLHYYTNHMSLLSLLLDWTNILGIVPNMCTYLKNICRTLINYLQSKKKNVSETRTIACSKGCHIIIICTDRAIYKGGSIHWPATIIGIVQTSKAESTPGLK